MKEWFDTNITEKVVIFGSRRTSKLVNYILIAVREKYSLFKTDEAVMRWLKG